MVSNFIFAETGTITDAQVRKGSCVYFTFKLYVRYATLPKYKVLKSNENPSFVFRVKYLKNL